MKKIMIMMILLVSAPVFADEIHLLNGSVFKGKIIEVDVKSVEYTSARTGQVETLEKDQVSKIVYDDGEVLVINEPKGSAPARTPVTRNGENYGVYENPSFLFGVEAGWNGFSGIGIRAEIPFGTKFSINGGAGIGTWGWRLSGFGKLYFGDGPYGFAIGFGAAYNTGLNDYKTDMETESGTTEEVTFNFKPSTSLIGTLSYSWRTSGSSKIYIEAGFASPLKKEYEWSTKSGYKLTAESEDMVSLLANNGIVLTLGYMF